MPLSANLSGIEIYDFHIAEQMNNGITWSCIVPGRMGDSITMGEAALAGSLVYVMQLFDDAGYPYESPPLIPCKGIDYEYSTASGASTTLSGTDVATWKLSQPNQSLLTFKNSNALTIIAAISAASGVQIITTGANLNINVAEEDIKQSTWWMALRRIAEVACCNLMITRSGAVAFVPLVWSAETCFFEPETINYKHDPSKRVTGFVVSKKTSHYQPNATPSQRYYTFDSTGYKVQQLRQPISNASAADRSDVGSSISVVGFWDGDPSDSKSKLIALDALGNFGDASAFSAPKTGSWPAKFVTVLVQNGAPPFDELPISARLEVLGSTPATVAGVALTDVDLAFTVVVGTIKGANARPGPVRNESMYPSAAWVTSHATELLYEANKGANPITASGPIDCTARVGGRLQVATPDPIPPARIDRVEHTGNSEGFSTSISGFAIPW